MAKRDKKGAKAYKQPARLLQQAPEASRLEKIFGFGALLVLLATTVFWAILGSRIQMGNADQLIDTRLFESGKTLHDASIPLQHTFLLKWPLFWLIHQFGTSTLIIELVTVTLAVATVGIFACIVYKIARRPAVFGILCLLLASVLLAIPAQPHPGTILPVNMAMLTTRNIEYVLYMLSLILLAQIQITFVKSWRFWLATGIAALLVASDGLFLPLYVGGALVLLAVYGLMRKRQLVRFALHWLVSGAISAGLAPAILWIAGRGIPHIVGAGSTPYSFIKTAHDLALGLCYGVLDLLSDFGANPAHDSLTLRDIPHDAIASLAGVGGLVFIVNLAAFCACVVAAACLIRRSLNSKKPKKSDDAEKSWPRPFAIALLASSVIALASFVLSNHYYPVDARYVSIVLFALIVALAVIVKDWRLSRKAFMGLAIVLGLSIGSGVAASLTMYHAENTAMASVNTRNSLVAAAMQGHATYILAGDYWRVLPAQQAAKGAFTALPLNTCTTPSTVLTSTAWNSNFTKHSFAYLLSYDAHSADFPSCTLDQVVKAYGRPNKSVLIAGSLENPQELVLFYDHGVHPYVPNNPTKAPASVVPVSLSGLPAPVCPTGRSTVMSVVAHQDDDLLFMNPDHFHDIDNGDCMRTVYLTAGDSGFDQLYWLGREKGSEAAYDLMDGPTKDIWVERIVKISAHEYVQIVNPSDNPRISLIFVHLPDGNINGAGFRSTHYESLARLQSGKINAIQSVDGQSYYSSNDVKNLLAALIDYYRPNEVDTQTPINLGKQYPDHSDHITTGKYTEAAYKESQTHTMPGSVIKYYTGYPIHALPSNVSGDDYQRKGMIFFLYSHFDGGGCSTFTFCDKESTYGSYLAREYEYHPSE